MSTEKEIEDFLARNPYLIDGRFAGTKPAQQLTRNRLRLDIMIPMRSVSCIVEIKRGPLNPAAVKQLESYHRAWSGKTKLAARHYLVGREAGNPEALARAIRDCPFGIVVRRLGPDIPLRFIYDLREKKYVPFREELAAMTGRYEHPREFII